MYIEKNLNPKSRKVGDCTIRAVAAATGLGWDKAYKQLAEAGFHCKCCMCNIEAVDMVLKNNGFKVGKIQVVKGGKRPTVNSFAKENPTLICVLRVAGHLVATGYGNYVDIWDCGEKSVYKYWYKETV